MYNLKSTPDLKTGLRLLRQQDRPVIITRHGDEAAVLIPLEWFEKYLESCPLPRNPEELYLETIESMDSADSTDAMCASSLEDPINK